MKRNQTGQVAMPKKEPDINKKDKMEMAARKRDIVARISELEDMMTGKTPAECGMTMNDIVSERNALMVRMHSFLNSIYDYSRSKSKGRREY